MGIINGNNDKLECPEKKYTAVIYTHFVLSTGIGGPDVYCTSGGWHLLFDLAREYGWEPLGTIYLCWYDLVDEQGAPIPAEQEVPTREDFGGDMDKRYGSYFYSDGQLVDKDDCKAMLLALESAKSDIAKGNLREGTCAEMIARSVDARVILDDLIVVCNKGFFFIF